MTKERIKYLNDRIEAGTADYFAAEENDSFLILDEIYTLLMERECMHTFYVDDLIRELIETKSEDRQQFESYLYFYKNHREALTNKKFYSEGYDNIADAIKKARGK